MNQCFFWYYGQMTVPISLIDLIIDHGFLLLDATDFKTFETSKLFGFSIPQPDRAGG
jgi:hypothetical protein